MVLEKHEMLCEIEKIERARPGSIVPPKGLGRGKKRATNLCSSIPYALNHRLLTAAADLRPSHREPAAPGARRPCDAGGGRPTSHGERAAPVALPKTK